MYWTQIFHAFNIYLQCRKLYRLHDTVCAVHDVKHWTVYSSVQKTCIHCTIIINLSVKRLS